MLRANKAMLKLYRVTERKKEYWKAWATTTEITIHWGKLGEEGEEREIPIKPGAKRVDLKYHRLTANPATTGS